MSTTYFRNDLFWQRTAEAHSTAHLRWLMSTPGPGVNPAVTFDPHIRLTHWAGNGGTNTTNLQSAAMGLDRKYVRGCPNAYAANLDTTSHAIPTPKDLDLHFQAVHMTAPSWELRGEKAMDLTPPSTDWNQPHVMPNLSFHQVNSRDLLARQARELEQRQVHALPTDHGPILWANQPNAGVLPPHRGIRVHAGKPTGAPSTQPR